jgi:hypothetical protein
MKNIANQFGKYSLTESRISCEKIDNFEKLNCTRIRINAVAYITLNFTFPDPDTRPATPCGLDITRRDHPVKCCQADRLS